MFLSVMFRVDLSYYAERLEARGMDYVPGGLVMGDCAS